MGDNGNSGDNGHSPASPNLARGRPQPRKRVSGRISLALTLHNHQPVGNFGWVIAETYERAYRPMLQALERHPGVQLALH